MPAEVMAAAAAAVVGVVAEAIAEATAAITAAGLTAAVIAAAAIMDRPVIRAATAEHPVVTAPRFIRVIIIILTAAATLTEGFGASRFLPGSDFLAAIGRADIITPIPMPTFAEDLFRPAGIIWKRSRTPITASCTKSKFPTAIGRSYLVIDVAQKEGL